MFKNSTAVAFIDDDEALRAANVQSLELAGFEVSAFGSARQALAMIGPEFGGVVITDIRMPDMDGRMLFRQLREVDQDIPVILITGHADIAEAVQAMHEGAYDYLAKPYGADRLIGSTRRALDKRRLVLDNRRLLAVAARSDVNGSLIGETVVMARLRSTIQQIGETDVDVLVEGETGVGKELVARLIHRASRRRSHPFVALDFAALPESMTESELFGHEAGAFNGAVRRRVGRIESADRGTLFLDELESMPATMQGKLLRVLEEREVVPVGGNEQRCVDVRVVAAAKGDLGGLVDQGVFRNDLFYRLNVVRIRIPPLRERREDIPLLFGRFLANASARFGREQPTLTEGVRLHLLSHDWPGNVRELSHFAERVALGVADLDVVGTGQDFGSLPDRIDAFEAHLIRDALARCDGDAKATVETLGIPRKTFYDKLQKHRIDIKQYRPPGRSR
jgi:two-component system C4-dicarboxylate transport response regulator DctD